MIKIIDWNMLWDNHNNNKLNYILSLKKKKTIIILEEVTPEHYKEINKYSDEYNIRYSLNYRKPGKYDSKQRKLGIAILTSKDIEIVKAKCINRSLLPDRTLLVECKYKNEIIKVLGLHSITGCDHKKAKSIQFLSFAEAIDKHKPDIVAFDANEPDIDISDVSKMVFFDNKDKGKGARTFFETLNEDGLNDSYTFVFDKNKYVKDKPLVTSHIINGKLHKRYDFIFTKYKVKDCKYLLKEGIKYGSDHAIVECDFSI